MANPEHVKVVRQGAAAIAEWRQQNPGIRFDLRETDLARANLVRANLARADLARANLSQADLRWADLSGAALGHADLSRADLSGANFFDAVLTRADLNGALLVLANLFDADLRGANLRDANLALANLFGANLTATQLAGSRLGLTALGNCDLSRADGLSAINHTIASSIGVDTLIRSFRGAGNRLTPDLEAFFLGAGVPKELLEQLPQIIGAVEYYSCFIAHGKPDEGFAKRLCNDLEARGVPCWFYPMDATPGERTWPEIGLARRQADKMVVVCSVKALLRDGVLKEVEEQIDDDPDKMVPISRDDVWTDPGFRVMRAGRDLTPWLRDRNYADFSDESCYEDSLQRVLKALRRKAE